MIQRPDASARHLLARLKIELRAIRNEARTHEREHVGKLQSSRGYCHRVIKKKLTRAYIIDECGCCDTGFCRFLGASSKMENSRSAVENRAALACAGVVMTWAVLIKRIRSLQIDKLMMRLDERAPCLEMSLVAQNQRAFLDPLIFFLSFPVLFLNILSFCCCRGGDGGQHDDGIV